VASTAAASIAVGIMPDGATGGTATAAGAIGIMATAVGRGGAITIHAAAGNRGQQGRAFMARPVKPAQQRIGKAITRQAQAELVAAQATHPHGRPLIALHWILHEQMLDDGVGHAWVHPIGIRGETEQQQSSVLTGSHATPAAIGCACNRLERADR
jgi:hypothetical protein